MVTYILRVTNLFLLLMVSVGSVNAVAGDFSTSYSNSEKLFQLKYDNKVIASGQKGIGCMSEQDSSRKCIQFDEAYCTTFIVSNYGTLINIKDNIQSSECSFESFSNVLSIYNYLDSPLRIISGLSVEFAEINNNYILRYNGETVPDVTGEKALGCNTGINGKRECVAFNSSDCIKYTIDSSGKVINTEASDNSCGYDKQEVFLKIYNELDPAYRVRAGFIVEYSQEQNKFIIKYNDKIISQGEAGAGCISDSTDKMNCTVFYESGCSNMSFNKKGELLKIDTKEKGCGNDDRAEFSKIYNGLDPKLRLRSGLMVVYSDTTNNYKLKYNGVTIATGQLGLGCKYNDDLIECYKFNTSSCEKFTLNQDGEIVEQSTIDECGSDNISKIAELYDTLDSSLRLRAGFVAEYTDLFNNFRLLYNGREIAQSDRGIGCRPEQYGQRSCIAFNKYNCEQLIYNLDGSLVKSDILGKSCSFEKLSNVMDIYNQLDPSLRAINGFFAEYSTLQDSFTLSYNGRKMGEATKGIGCNEEWQGDIECIGINENSCTQIFFTDNGMLINSGELSAECGYTKMSKTNEIYNKFEYNSRARAGFSAEFAKDYNDYRIRYNGNVLAIGQRGVGCTPEQEGSRTCILFYDKACASMKINSNGEVVSTKLKDSACGFNNTTEVKKLLGTFDKSLLAIGEMG